MSRPTLCALALALLTTAHVLAPAPVRAQSQGGAVDIQLFRPAIDTKGLFTLDAVQPLAHLALSLRSNLSYAYRPLVISGNPQGGTWCSDGTSNCQFGDDTYQASRYRVDHLVTGHLGGAIGLFKRFEIGFGFPIAFWRGSTEPSPTLTGDPRELGRTSALGLGDPMLHLKAKFVGEPRFGVALGSRLTVAFPLGRDDAFLGSGRFRVTPVLLAERHFWRRRIQLLLNVGGHFRFGGETEPWVDQRQCPLPGTGALAECGTGRTLETTHHVFYGAGIGITVVRRRLEFIAEFNGQSGFNGLFDLDPEGPLVSAHEVLAGLRLRFMRRTFFEAGVGMGLNGGDQNVQYGSPRFRAYFGLSIEATLRAAKEQAKKIANYGPVKKLIAVYRKKAKAKLDGFIAKARKKAEAKAKAIALATLSKTLEGVIPSNAEAIVAEIMGAFERWQQIQTQLVEYSAARGADLRRAQRKLKRLLAAGAITTTELERAVRAWVKKRVVTLVRVRCEALLTQKLDALLRPVFDKAGNALTSLAGSVPGVGGMLSVSVNLVVAKARSRLHKALTERALKILDGLLERTFNKLYAKLFHKGGKLDGTLSWLNSKSGTLSKLLDETVDRLERQRLALLKKIR